MNILFVSIDSLRRDFLSSYRDQPFGYDYSVETPNLDRFAERATVFDTHYAGSLFCMPARREWLTGTREFLWRGWGPIEPFDETLPRLARTNGVLSGLITDHYHYFQHGADGYYEDFNAFDFIRGHEYDAWRTAPREIDVDFASQVGAEEPDSLSFMNRAQYARNVAAFDHEEEEDFFAPTVFKRAAEWVEANKQWDDWFLFVDSFDVHEPFHCPEPYASMYTDHDPRDRNMPAWPYWGRIDRGQSQLTADQQAFVKAQFAGKVTMVDHWFGRLLDRLDRLELWDDTMVVVTADHGFSLGDHGWLGKSDGALYDVLAHTPLLIWHPDYADTVSNVEALTSAVDLHPTLAATLGATDYESPHGKSLLPLLAGEVTTHRERALYGIWGSDLNVTDGQYTYHRQCDESEPAVVHCSRPINPYAVFQPPEPQPDAEAVTALPYTSSPVWRYDAMSNSRQPTTLLFDTDADPAQETNLATENGHLEERMRGHLLKGLDALDAPSSEYRRVNMASKGD